MLNKSLINVIPHISTSQFHMFISHSFLQLHCGLTHFYHSVLTTGSYTHLYETLSPPCLLLRLPQVLMHASLLVTVCSSMMVRSWNTVLPHQVINYLTHGHQTSVTRTVFGSAMISGPSFHDRGTVDAKEVLIWVCMSKPQQQNFYIQPLTKYSYPILKKTVWSVWNDAS